MKKTNTIIAFFAMAIVAIAVAVVSCKKEKQEQNLSNTDNMDAYLKSFKEQLLSQEKGNAVISLEQAQRDLGNLLNYDFGDANYISNVFHRDTLRVGLATMDGMVSLSQLSVTYGYARELIEKAYEKVDLPEKSVLAIHCFADNETLQNESVDLVLVLVTRGFDYGSRDMSYVHPGKHSIDATDCWHVAQELGRCDGTDVGYDHASILQLVYNNNIPLYACSNGGHLYYTDIHTYSFYAYEYPETDSTTFYNLGYRLWRGYLSGWNSGLVSSDEMSYYYNNLCDIIVDKMSSVNTQIYRLYTISCAVIQEPEPEPDKTQI